MTKVRLVAAMMVAATTFCFFSPRTCDADRDGSRQVMRQKPPSGKPAHGHGSGTQNLIDHGGPVLLTPHVYAIYWGSFSGSDVQPGLMDFFGGFGGSSYSNILTQYLRGASNPSTSYQELGTETTLSPPSHGPSVATIASEACKFIGAGVAPDTSGVYFVITSNFPKGGNFCAWHSLGSCNGQPIPVVYLPNPNGVTGCAIAGAGGNPYTVATQSSANIAAHELAEVITDPQLDAWFDSGGQEIGDKCAWQFGSPVSLGSTTWELQELWSNAVSGCVQSLP